jgi:hypothetical protein
MRGVNNATAATVPAVSPTWTRGNIRRARRSPEDDCGDWCRASFRTCCSVTQDAIELKKLKQLAEAAGGPVQAVVNP